MYLLMLYGIAEIQLRLSQLKCHALAFSSTFEISKFTSLLLFTYLFHFITYLVPTPTTRAVVNWISSTLV